MASPGWVARLPSPRRISQPAKSTGGVCFRPGHLEHDIHSLRHPLHAVAFAMKAWQRCSIAWPRLPPEGRGIKSLLKTRRWDDTDVMVESERRAWSGDRGRDAPDPRGHHPVLALTLAGGTVLPRSSSSPPWAGSTIKKRSVTLDGHKTSVSIEDDFWEALIDISRTRRQTVGSLIEEIDRDRLATNLSSAIRLFVLCAARAGRLEAVKPS